MLLTELVTLGQFQLSIGDCIAVPPPTHKSRALLAFLISNASRDIARERLLELFWGECEPDRAREGLRTALSSIRRVLRDANPDAAALLFSDKAIVRWIAPAEYDAARFAQLAQNDGVADKQAAVVLYSGDFLEGNYEEWVVRERERLAALYESTLASILESTGDPKIARELLQRNPYHERAYAALIDSELQGNRLTAAAELLAQYHAAMSEAGSEPSPEFRNRFARIEELSEKDGAQITVPFIARIAELQLLDAAFRDRVGTDGFVALIVGEPGIGKTALLSRAMELARIHDRRALSVRCRDDPRRLEAWRGLYASLTGNRLDELVGGRADVATAAARDMVGAFGKPTVIFVDDSHALQGDSLATLSQVTRIAQVAGHGVVITLRPEGRERIEAALRASPHETLVLQPLERGDIEAVLARLIDSESDSFAGALYERSAGHPLFFVALLQSLVQRRSLRREQGRWRLTRRFDERLELPNDLRASIETRLRSAGDDAVTLACALALEPSATAEDLAAVLNVEQSRAFDALDQLLIFDLIREAAKPAQYEFVHDLVREAASTLLNAGRRVALHWAFAHRFQQNKSLAASVCLARHLRAAGSALPAAAAFLDSAKMALAKHAVRDAMRYCDEGLRALETVQHDAELEALLSRLERARARAAGNAGEISLALDAADEAVRYARVSAQPLETAKSLIVRSSLHGALNDCGVQLSDALEASALAGELGESSLRARAAVEAAAATRSSGAVDEAVQLAREAAEAAQACDDPAAVYAAHEELLKAQVCWWRFNDARRTLYETWAVAERVGPAALARLCCIRGAYQYLLDRRETARDELRAAMHYIDLLRVRSEAASPNLSYRYPFPLIAVVAEYLWGVFACEDGAWENALQAVSSCKEFEAIANLPRYQSAVTMLEIDALLGRGGVEDGARAAELAGELFENVNPDGIVGLSDCSTLINARISARLQRPEAGAQLRTALDALEENARRIPIDSDRAFRRLAASAQEAQQAAIAERALSRSRHYAALRQAASSLELQPT